MCKCSYKLFVVIGLVATQMKIAVSYRTPITAAYEHIEQYHRIDTATDGNSGTLPAITTTSTVNLPVAEVQTLTTNAKNPRQN